jgi:23S rRNA pseudouridine2605 synthase
MTEKLQKVLARAGFGSRREIETWISKGRVKVNGKVAVVGDRVDDEDQVTVDGKKLSSQAKQRFDRRILLYNKPENEISVGRLDINTSGLLLFTTDGELANKLMHPSFQIEREYAVRVMGEVTQEIVDLMHKGVMIEGNLCRFTDIQYFAGDGANQWYHVVLIEGRNREVRKLWESQGLKVSRLKRVRFGTTFMPSTITKGQFRELPKQEVDKLLKLVAGPKSVE